MLRCALVAVENPKAHCAGPFKANKSRTNPTTFLSSNVAGKRKDPERRKKKFFEHFETLPVNSASFDDQVTAP
jgi:hypothetical protein